MAPQKDESLGLPVHRSTDHSTFTPSHSLRSLGDQELSLSTNQRMRKAFLLTPDWLIVGEQPSPFPVPLHLADRLLLSLRGAIAG